MSANMLYNLISLLSQEFCSYVIIILVDKYSQQLHNFRSISIGLCFCHLLELVSALTSDTFRGLYVSHQISRVHLVGEDLDNLVDPPAAVVITNIVKLKVSVPCLGVIIVN